MEKDTYEKRCRSLLTQDIVLLLAQIYECRGRQSFLEKEGADMLVEKISVKPGSPSTVSVLDGKMIISLSGNPFAAAVHTELLVRSAISCLSGCEELFPKENRGVSGSDFENIPDVIGIYGEKKGMEKFCFL